MNIYSLCDVTIEVSCPNTQQRDQLDQLWCMLFNVRQLVSAFSTPHISFQFKPAGTFLNRPTPAQLIWQSQQFSIWKTQNGYYLQCGTSILDVDLIQRRVTGVINQGFWSYPLATQRDFFMSSFLLLFRLCQRYGLHANGVVKNDVGCLIAGGSGYGKTTLTLGLVTAGWSYVADDAIALWPSMDGIQALPIRRSFSCTPETAAYFPNLHIAADEAPDLDSGKKLVMVDSIYPDRIASNCTPQILLFPEITGAQRSRLTEIDDKSALFKLMYQSAGIQMDPSLVSKQLNILTQLINQCQSYQFLLGTDVFEEPQAVSNLLWEKRRDQVCVA